MIPWRAPATSPPRIIPSISRCPPLVMMWRSLIVPGSLSSALQTMNLSGPGWLRTSSHFMPVGKPAPPRPRRPLALSVAISPAQSFDCTNDRSTPYCDAWSG